MIVDIINPEFYVYLLNVGNSQVKFSSLYFEYDPAQVLTTISTEDLYTIQDVDFIMDRNDITITNNQHSLVNFSYDLSRNQKFSITTRKLEGSTSETYIYEFTINYEIIDGSYLYLYILNLNNTNISIQIKYGDNTYTVAEQIVEVKISTAGGIIITKRNLPPPE